MADKNISERVLNTANAYIPRFDLTSQSQWYITLPAAAFILVCTIITYRILFHPLASFPGPFLARFSGSWRNTRFWRGTWHDDVLNLHKRYGMVVRAAPSELSIVDEQATKLLVGHGTNAVKTTWYNTWSLPPSRVGMFPTQDKAWHSFLRKGCETASYAGRVSSVYSMSAILRCEEYVQQLLDLMMERLRVHSQDSGVVDMFHWTQYLAFDVAGELGFVQTLGQLETESDTLDMSAKIHMIFYLTTNMGHYLGQMLWFTHPLIRRINQVLGIPDPMVAVRSWTTKQITDRQAKNEAGVQSREDMLAHFVRMKNEAGKPADVNEILLEGMNMIGAGADTTSVAMRTCLYELCRSPEWYKKQTLDLPMLCATIREAMRLLPSITYPLYRYAPPGMEVGSYSIPAGTAIGMSPGAANRNKSVWGDDADQFRPDRWLEDEDKAKYLNVNDMTFGGDGARACIGKNLALVEVHKFVAQILHNFDLDFVNPAKPWRMHSQWFANQYDMHMKIKSRQR
ncbi:Putative cytochrome P450 [Septoria linicola]|uniref:Cytochrome P450 n=1 Tax=Septoria linicola TaxID=215465 RepID=A0A9Q9AW84_9PEZI|nr:Putative cytochrome P450 [Septoria linicola]